MKFTSAIWLLVACASAAPIFSVKRQNDSDSHWVASWASMPQLVEQNNMPPSPFGGFSGNFAGATLRQTVHMSIGAERIRIQFSNTFGGSALPITAASVALPTGGKAGVGSIDVSTLVPLTFGGSPSVSIPQGQIAYSDPVDFKVAPQSVLTISLYSQQGQSGGSITGHPGSRTTSWMQQGNQVNASTVTGASTVHWYFVNVVEAWAPARTGALVILGDSITDGRGSDDNQNNRWPDLLLARAQKEGIDSVAFVNEAAGGNAVLSGGLGPNLLSRYKRDALEQEGVKAVLIFEGVNDLGGGGADAGTQQRIGQGLVDAYKRIAGEARAAGLLVYGATITPFGGNGQSYSSPVRDQARQTVNSFLLSAADVFDGVVDFAKMLANQANPSTLAAQYDGGDHLHPNVAGYQQIANQFPLEILRAIAAA